jgi:hypothetical protein
VGAHWAASSEDCGVDRVWETVFKGSGGRDGRDVGGVGRCGVGE